MQSYKYPAPSARKWKTVFVFFFFFFTMTRLRFSFWQTFILIEAEKKKKERVGQWARTCGGVVCNLLKALNHSLASATAYGPLQSYVKSHPAPMHQSHEWDFLFSKGRNNQAGSWNPIPEVYSPCTASCPTFYRPQRGNCCPLYNLLCSLWFDEKEGIYRWSKRCFIWSFYSVIPSHIWQELR